MGKVINNEIVEIGEKIRFFRRCRGMGQEALAEAADVSYMTISRIENGTTTMNILTLKRIASALKVSPDEILMPGEIEIHYRTIKKC